MPTLETLDVVSFLRSGGTDLEKLRPTESIEKAPQFFSYYIDGEAQDDEVINVESTARSAMTELLCLPVDAQKMVFVYIARMVKNPGDQAILQNDNKRRGARIVRLASGNDREHNFLLTH